MFDKQRFNLMSISASSCGLWPRLNSYIAQQRAPTLHCTYPLVVKPAAYLLCAASLLIAFIGRVQHDAPGLLAMHAANKTGARFAKSVSSGHRRGSVAIVIIPPCQN